MLLVQPRELRAVLLVVQRSPGREMTAKKRTGSRSFGTGCVLLIGVEIELHRSVFYGVVVKHFYS